MIHNRCFWFENDPIKITKHKIHRVTGYPILDPAKSMSCGVHEIIKKEIGAKWNKCGMIIDSIFDPMVEFLVRVFTHKFYQSSILNSVPCIAMDLGFKIIKKDHSYDLVDLQLQ